MSWIASSGKRLRLELSIWKFCQIPRLLLQIQSPPFSTLRLAPGSQPVQMNMGHGTLWLPLGLCQQEIEKRESEVRVFIPKVPSL